MVVGRRIEISKKGKILCHIKRIFKDLNYSIQNDATVKYSNCTRSLMARMQLKLYSLKSRYNFFYIILVKLLTLTEFKTRIN